MFPGVPIVFVEAFPLNLARLGSRSSGNVFVTSSRYRCKIRSALPFNKSSQTQHLRLILQKLLYHGVLLRVTRQMQHETNVEVSAIEAHHIRFSRRVIAGEYLPSFKTMLAASQSTNVMEYIAAPRVAL